MAKNMKIWTLLVLLMLSIAGCGPEKSPELQRNWLEIDRENTFMPCMSHRDDYPVIAMYNDMSLQEMMNAYENDTEEFSWLCFAIWPDGQLIWSENGADGGHPYLQTQLTAKQLHEMAKRIADVGLTSSNMGTCCLLAIRAPHTWMTINIKDVYYTKVPHRGCYEIFRNGQYEDCFVDDIIGSLGPMLKIERIVREYIPENGKIIDSRTTIEPGKIRV
ncbi:MAG: hypothetical protein JEZ07_12325 [Phycisphaerae bacterium]|nr:hypothetical protein [Phycisphaerae bacterium]